MGNAKSKKSKKPARSLKPYAPAEEADVESLHLPFSVGRRIFLLLQPSDLALCMRVCKEWRSIVDTCVFWKAYLEKHFDFGLCEPRRGSPLYRWKYEACINLNNLHLGGYQYETYNLSDQQYVFNPFPDLWISQIIVPYALGPPDGSIDVYHNFIQALVWLSKLKAKLRECGLSGVMHPILLPWFKDRMPSSREILSILGLHRDITETCYEALPMTNHEMQNYFGMLNTRFRGAKFNSDLYFWLADHVALQTLIFDCNLDIVDPAPSFIITSLSTGWIGGLLYAI